MPTKIEQREFKRFTLVGFSATVMDYGILNLLAHVFGVPIVFANIVSASTSSLYSYILNRKVVFNSIAHGERRSLLLYALSLLVSIFVIQSTVIAIFGRGLTEQWYETLGISGQMKELLALNTAKVIAGLCSIGWNFYMQRRFVFRSNSQKHN
ncbi:MAG: GtrA family protein [Patescibacteria group bacterium]